MADARRRRRSARPSIARSRPRRPVVVRVPPLRSITLAWFASRARSGTATRTVVPRPGRLSSSNVPPSWRARSRMLTSPRPPLSTCPGSRPRPSSAMVRTTSRPARVSRTLDARRRGVLRRVAERLLCDPVEGEAGALGKVGHGRLDLAGDRDPVRLAERVAVAAQHFREAHLLQLRRMQVVGELTDLGPDVDQLALHVGDHLPRFRVGGDLPFRRAQDQAERGDLLHHAVVELAGDPGSLLLLRLHQPLVERGDLRRVSLDDPARDAVGGPEQRRERPRPRARGTSRLVVRGRDRELERGAGLVPDPAVVGGLDAEGCTCPASGSCNASGAG